MNRSLPISRRRLLGGTSAGLAAVTLGCGKRQAKNSLSLLTWGNYLAPAVIEGCRRELGVEVVQDFFLAEAEMAAKLRAGATHDLAATIDYLLSSLQRDGLISPLPAELKGRENLAEDFPFWEARADRGGGLYGMPYLWGTTGIGYDVEKVGEIDSWAALFDERWKGRITVLDSKGDVMDQGLLAAGMDINSIEKDRIRNEVYPALQRQRELVRAYDSNPAAALVRGDVWIAQIDSGDLLQARAQRPSLRYVIPKEGAARWTDYLVVPAKSPGRDAARSFLEYLLRPEVAAANANYLRFATPNARALAEGKIDDADDPNIYPPPAVRERLFESENWAGNTGKLVDELWLQLRAG